MSQHAIEWIEMEVGLSTLTLLEAKCSILEHLLDLQCIGYFGKMHDKLRNDISNPTTER